MPQQSDVYRPSTAEVITSAIRARMAEFHTGLPAKVVAFDEKKQTCDVQPLLQRVIVDEDRIEVAESLPQIPNVPIIYASAGGWSLIFPLKVDDIVFLTFAERSIDTWLEGQSGAEVDPIHSHMNDLSDAVAIPGIRPRTSPIKPLAGIGDNCRLGHEDGDPALLLKPDGTIEVGEGAMESAVFGDALKTLLGSVSWPFVGVAPGAPGMTTPLMATMPTFWDTMLSAKVKIK